MHIKNSKILLIIVSVLSIITSYQFQIPFGRVGTLSDKYFLSEPQLTKSSYGSIRDYLPQTVSNLDVKRSIRNVILKPIGTGEAFSKNLIIRSNYWSLDVEVNDSQGAVVSVPIFYFPGWEVASNGVLITSYPDSKTGLITFKLSEGKYIINGWLKPTSIQLIGNTLTVISYVCLIFIYINFKNNYSNEN